MTRKRFSILIVMLALFSASALYAVDNAYLYKSSAATGKKSHVDLHKVSDDYKLTKDYEKAFKSKVEEKDAERNVFVEEIRRIKKEAPMLSASERENQQAVVDKKIEELKNFDRKTRDWLIAARDAMLGDIQSKIDSEVRFIGDTEGYESITVAQVLKEGKDITSQVIRGLNEKYENKKRGGVSENTALKSPSAIEATPDVSKNSTNDTVTQLERLASLKEKGILTEEEFQGQKKKILAR